MPDRLSDDREGLLGGSGVGEVVQVSPRALIKPKRGNNPRGKKDFLVFGQKIRRNKKSVDLVSFVPQKFQDQLSRIDDKAALLVAEGFASDERPHTFGNRLRNAWGGKHDTIREKERVKPTEAPAAPGSPKTVPMEGLSGSIPRCSRYPLSDYRRFLFAAASAARMRCARALARRNSPSFSRVRRLCRSSCAI